MATTTQVQWRKGSAAANAMFGGAVGEISVDTDNSRIVVHDGSTLGGWTGARQIDLDTKMSSLSGYCVTNFTSTANTYLTGVILISRDATISGVLDGYIRNTGQQSWLAADNNGKNLSGNLALSGSNIYSLITNFSGGLNANYATVATLQTTGQTLYNLVTALSGQSNINYATALNLASTGQQAWLAANNNGINLSGNLTQTGIALIARDVTVSGVLQGYINSVAASPGAVYQTGYQIITGSKTFLGFESNNSLSTSGRILYNSGGNTSVD